MKELFLTVLNMSLTASYVILFVMLVRLPLKKAPKVLSYAMWMVVAFRLVCPFSFESMVSLIPQSTSPIPLDIAYQSNPQINSGIESIDMIVTAALPAPVVEASINPLQLYTQIGAYIWIALIAAMLIYSIVSVMILKRRLENAKPAEPNIYEADNLKTPFVLGFIRPKIYLPARLGEEERRCILLHEQTHIRRYDHVIKPFAFFLLSVHWFNPLVWIAFLLMSTDMELSCDEKVLKETGIHIKKPYAASLLSLATGRRVLNGSPLAFGEGNVKGRIKNVLGYKKPSFWIVASAIVVVAVVSIGLLANPQSNMLTQTEPLAFKTTETDLVQIGKVAFDEYMETLTSKITPMEERIASYQLNDISVLAGDSNEFCVSLHYDFTSANDSYMNPGRGAKGKGIWPDNYMEIRIKNIGEHAYKIVDIGTGGGGQGLVPYASQQTALEPIPPGWSPEQSLGADMASLDYASDDIVIFHGYFGLFVYDLDSLHIIRSLDLKPIKCNATQGDDYCEVSVSMDGNTVQLHRMSSKNMYVYTVSSNTLQEMPYERMSNQFGSGFVPIEDVADSKQLGLYSHNAIKFDTGEYGYLHSSDWTLGTFTYVRGDMIYRLFDTNESENTNSQNSAGAEIVDSVSGDLITSHSDIEVTNEWISKDFGYTVLFGSMKSDPQQGIAVVIPTGDQSDKSEHRVLTPSKHGAIKADSLGAKASILDVVAEDGYKWIFNVYNGFDAKN